MSDYYILDGHTPVATDLLTWGKWYETAERHVADTKVNNEFNDGKLKDGVRVSTVFLGFDHQYGEGPPLLFETMIFGGEHDDYCEHCSTWEEAKKMHAEACKLAFGVKS